METNKSLFQITDDFKAIIEALIENGGEVSEEIESSLNLTKVALYEKSESYVNVVKKIEYDVKIIDEEVKRLNALKKARKSAIERLKSSLSYAMNQFDIDKIEDSLYKISFRRSEAVNIIDEDNIDKKYWKLKTELNKAKIKEDLKAGIEIEGAVLQVNKNIQIK